MRQYYKAVTFYCLLVGTILLLLSTDLEVTRRQERVHYYICGKLSCILRLMSM